MSLHVRDGSSWKTVESGDNLKVRDGGSWKTVVSGQVRDGGSWKEFYVGSDPLNLDILPKWSSAYGETHLEQAQYTMDEGYVWQGDWDTVGHPSGMQRTRGVIRYDPAEIQSAAGGRGVVQPGTVVLFGLKTYSQYTGAGISARVYSTTYNFTNTKPTKLTSAPALANLTTGPRQTTSDASQAFTLPDAVGQGFLDGSIKALVFYDSGTSSSAKELYRGGFQGAGMTFPPRLLMQVDYS